MSELITIEQYLRHEYENERECEFVDGVLEERTGGNMAHGILHGEVGAWFWQHRSEWNIGCLMSYSMWVSGTRIRVPDLVITNDRLREDIRVTPPLLCVEILAPEDHPVQLLRRLDDMIAMGVGNLWLLDPIARVALTYTKAGLVIFEGDRLSIPDSPIYLDLPEVFSALD